MHLIGKEFYESKRFFSSWRGSSESKTNKEPQPKSGLMHLRKISWFG